MRWNLLEGYVDNTDDFKELEIGKKIVYWHQRMLGKAKVEKDYIVFHFDKDSLDLGKRRAQHPRSKPEIQQPCR